MSQQDTTKGKEHLFQQKKTSLMINLCHRRGCSGADTESSLQALVRGHPADACRAVSWCCLSIPQLLAAALLLEVAACYTGTGKGELNAFASQFLPYKIWLFS